MAQTKIISYRQWRNHYINKGHYDSLHPGDESFRQLHDLARTFVLAADDAAVQPEVRLSMLPFGKKNKANPDKKLIQEMITQCKKLKLFRHKKVDEIKKQIKRHTYHVPGKAVVDKWFPDDSES